MFAESIIPDEIARLEPSQAILGMVILSVVGSFIWFLLRVIRIQKEERTETRAYISDLTERSEREQDKRDQIAKDMQANCHAVQRESNAVIKENTRVMALVESRLRTKEDQ